MKKINFSYTLLSGGLDPDQMAFPVVSGKYRSNIMETVNALLPVKSQSLRKS